MVKHKFQQLGLIGCGMMGGSFALAAKRAGLVESVVGYSKSPTNCEQAKALGAIDKTASSALQAVIGADLILIAVPVAATHEVLKAMQYGVSEDALVMDIGSTKQSVVHDATQVFGQMPRNFVPAHPVAGKEGAGISEADADLYVGRRVILTPTARTHARSIEQATQVWQALQMTVSTMTPGEHDTTYAAVSHLPHLLAFAFMNGLEAQKNGEAFLKMAGPGFRDFTRIAAADPEIWRDIFTLNRNELLRQSGAFLHSLSQIEYAIREDDLHALKKLIERASQSRSQWVLSEQTIDAVDD